MPTQRSSARLLRLRSRLRLRFRLPSRTKDLSLLLLSLLTLYLLFLHPSQHPQSLSSHQLLISLASSSASLPRRLPFLRLPHPSPTLLFLDKPPTFPLPLPFLISPNASNFPYSFPRGSPAAVRIARIVKHAVLLDQPDIRWYVFGDDDTVFFVDNLVRVLGKYDHEGMYYVGSGSESYGQGLVYGFEMAFGGGGFAISKGLGRALAGVLDDCLMRYPHLYGSDSRVYSCVAELGVRLTPEPGFHQVDVRGDIFGMLSAHPLSPLLSLHHLDLVDPIFPNMTKIQALEHLLQAYNVDPARILQQTVCYFSNSLTVSVSWGYSVQIFEGNHLLPDLLKAQRTFQPWRRKRDAYINLYTFNTRDFNNDTCRSPFIFFLDSVGSGSEKIWTDYTRNFAGNCWRTKGVHGVEHIRVFSQKLDYDIREAPRRQCCDVSSSFGRSMVINIRKCGVNELISMRT